MKGTDTAERLKSEWKLKLKEMGLHKEVRVMTSSCLDVCPDRAQAVAILKTHGEQTACVFDPEKESSEIFNQLVQLAQST